MAKKRSATATGKSVEQLAPHDPLHRAIKSAEQDFWTLRPPADVRHMVASAIKDLGRDKGFWVWEAVRLGLRKYAGKKDPTETILDA